MKYFLSTIFILFVTIPAVRAQNDISAIIGAGLIAAQDYSESYLSPAGEAFAFNLSTGWYDGARSLDQWEFSISIQGQAAFAPEDKKSFLLDPLEYEQLIQESYDLTSNVPGRIEVAFADGSRSPRQIATALGANETTQFLVIRAVDPNTGMLIDSSRIELAQGLESEGVNLVPTFFVQAGVGLGAGLEFKARFMPNIQIDNAETSLYGGALQWEVTHAFSKDGESVLPFRFALLAGYTAVDASYDFEDGVVVNGSNQLAETNASSLTFAAIASTKFKILNFYAGVNYAQGTTESNLLGTYTINSNSVIYPVTATFEDPLSVSTNATDITGTFGLKIKAGFFGFNGGYTIGEFDTANAAVSFSF
jgi:hypothetical protein